MTHEASAGSSFPALLFTAYLFTLLLSPVVVRQFWGMRTSRRWIAVEFALVPVLAVLSCFVFGLPYPPPAQANIPNGTASIYRVVYMGQFLFLALYAVAFPWLVVLAGMGLALVLPAFERAWQFISGRR